MSVSDGPSCPNKKVIGITAGAVVAVAAVGGGIWWATSSTADAPLGSPAAISAGEGIASDLVAGDEAITDRQTVSGEGLFHYGFAADDLAVGADGHPFISDQLVVSTAGEAGLDEVKQIAGEIDALVVGVNDYLGAYQLLLDAPASEDELTQLSAQIADMPGVEYAELNAVTSSGPESTEWEGAWGSDLGGVEEGNWGMQALGAPVIWDYAASETLERVPVGVVDVFYRDVWNEDLPDVRSQIPERSIDDPEQHGLHVSGTIAATHEGDDGVRGVAPNAELVIAASDHTRGYDEGIGEFFGWLDRFSTDEAFTFVVESGAKVVNMSFGAGNDAVQQARNGDEEAQQRVIAWGESTARTLNGLLEGRDFLVVKASGNASCTQEYVDADLRSCEGVVASDANLGLKGAASGTPLESHLITVGATEVAAGGYTVAGFSDKSADIAAPGVDIRSTGIDGTYLSSGTSMSAPHISGLAAALFGTDAELTADEVRELILGTANRTSVLQWNGSADEATSVPMANGAAAFQAALTAGALDDAARDDFIAAVAQGSLMGSELPASFGGTFCATASDCFDLNAYLAASDASLQVVADDSNGTRAISSTLTICADGSCEADSAVRLRYFPPGAVSDAASDEAGHNVAYPRIAQIVWDDAGLETLGTPYRLAPTAKGAVAELPFQAAQRPALSEASVEGAWQLVGFDGYSSEGDFTVRDGKMLYESGVTAGLFAGADEDGRLFLSGIASGYSSCDEEISVCWPIGELVPAGTAVDFGIGSNVTDFPDVDRIWSSQSGELYVRAQARSAADFPRAIQGEWCADVSDLCFDVADLLEEYPAAFVSYDEPSSDVAGTRSMSVCLVNDLGDGCSTAGSMFLRYFPAGVDWECTTVNDGKPMFSFDTCDPDYSDAHDVERDRLVLPLSHQHDAQYVDSVPLYRAG